MTGKRMPTSLPLTDETLLGFLPLTVLDAIPGTIAAEVFIPGCPYRCPLCHNHHLVKFTGSEDQLVPWGEILKQIQHSRLLSCLVVSGGEPMASPKIVEGIAEFAKENYLWLKIDTSGAYPWELSFLLFADLVDYVALDFKGLNYCKVAGLRTGEDTGDLGMAGFITALRLLRTSSTRFLIRTTACKEFHTSRTLRAMADILVCNHIPLDNWQIRDVQITKDTLSGKVFTPIPDKDFPEELSKYRVNPSQIKE